MNTSYDPNEYEWLDNIFEDLMVGHNFAIATAQANIHSVFGGSNE